MKRILLFLFVMSAGMILTAQSADEIIKNYFENTGGIEKWKALKTTKMEGKMALQGMEFPGSVTNKMPNKMRVDVSVMGMNIVQAYDGKDAWWINPFQGGTDPQSMPDEMAESVTNQEFQSPFLDYAAKGHKVEYNGTAEVEGAQTHVLKLTKKNGDVEYHYFDAEHFVIIMSKTPVKTGEAKGQFTETYMSDYQEVDGLMFPFFMETKFDGQSVQKMTFSSIKLNEEYKDDLFSMPKKK